MLDTQEYRVILVGIDGSSQAKEAFDKAIAVAKRNDAKIVITTVIENRLYGNMGYALTSADLLQTETNRAKTMLDEFEAYAKSQGITNIENVLAFGSPKVLLAEELPKEHHVDLIMVGQSGLTAVEKFMMGSVSSFVIRHAPCDVLVVRPSETQ